MNLGLSDCKYLRRHGGHFCNSTALTSLSTTQISSSLNLKSSSKDTESRFKGGQRGLVNLVLRL